MLHPSFFTGCLKRMPIFHVMIFLNYLMTFQVQSDHFEEFFAPELDKHGYEALYKKRTSEVVKKASWLC